MFLFYKPSYLEYRSLKTFIINWFTFKVVETQKQKILWKRKNEI